MPVDLLKKYNIDPNSAPRQPVDLLRVMRQKKPDNSALGEFNKYVSQPVINTVSGAKDFFYDAPANIANYISQKFTGRNVINQPELNEPYAQKDSLAYKTGKFIAPFLIPGLGAELGLANTAAKLPKAARIVAKAADLLGTNAIAGGVIGAGQGDKDLGGDALAGAVIGAPLQGALGAIPAAARSAINRYRTDEAMQKSKALGNLPANFFDVVGDSPKARVTGDILRNVPLVSSVPRKEENLVNATDNKVKDILTGLKGNLESSEVGSALHEAISDNFDKVTKKYNDKFEDILDKAAKRGHNIKYENTLKTLEKIQEEEHGTDEEQGNLVPAMSKGVIGRWADYFRNQPLDKEASDIVDSSGSKIVENEPNSSNNNSRFKINDKASTDQEKKQTFARAHNNQSIINLRSAEAAKAGNPRLASLYHRIHASVLDDTGESLKNNNDEELYKDFLEARQGFKRDVVPYRDKSIKNLIKGKVDPETAVTTLIKDKHAKVLNDLPADKRALLGYLKLQSKLKSDDLGKISGSAASIANAFASMPEKVKNKIYDARQQKSFRDLQSLANVSKEARGMRNMPMTGVRSNQDMIKSLLNLGGGSILVGLLTHPATTLPIAAGSVGASKAAEKLLYNPKIRKQLLGLEPSSAANVLSKILKQEPNLRKSAIYGITGNENDN